MQQKKIILALQLIFIILLLGMIYLSLFHSFQSTGSVISSKALDKHFVAYFTLSLVLSLIVILRGYRRLVLIGAAVALVLLSLIIEMVQPYFGRTASLADFLANATGIIVGVLIAFSLRKVMRKLFS